jgi:transposase-like protein
MAERRKRRRFTAEFKAQAVRHLLEGGKGPAEVATELGISRGLSLPRQHGRGRKVGHAALAICS